MDAAGPTKYFFVGYIQGHAAIPKIEGQVQTRKAAPQYDDITMIQLSIPGDQYVSTLMAPINQPPKSKHYWLGRSTEQVIPGILRDTFKERCDNPDNINEALRVVIERLTEVYKAANITFTDGFTVQKNPPDHHFWQLMPHPEEIARKSDGAGPRREASDRYIPLNIEECGAFCLCTNHPVLTKFSLTNLDDKEVEQYVDGTLTTDIIPTVLFPPKNMIGHGPGGMSSPTGASNWMLAIDESDTTPELKKSAKEIIQHTYRTKTLHSQDFITVLRALNIGHAYLINTGCRDLVAVERSRGGSRKRTTPRRRKITRKLKKRVFKKKPTRRRR